MAIVLRKEKGSPLTIEEMDGNFEHLNEKLCNLESSFFQAEGIKSFQQTNDIVEVMGTFGTILGRLKLPKLFPIIKGQWQERTLYTLNDWVVYDNCLFMCCFDHLSEIFDAEKERGLWREIEKTS